MVFSPRTETYVNLASLTTPFNITVTKPTGTVNGDILFCWIGWYAAVTIDSVPSGWTLLGQYIVNTDRYALYYKIANNEGASWVWSFTATSKVRAVCSCYTSGDFKTSDSIDAVSNTAYRTNNTSCIAASMNVASPKSPLVFWGGVYSTASKTFTKPSVPTTDWVEDDDAGHTTPDFWTEVCSMIWSESGATGNITATISASLAAKHAFAVALKPSVITRSAQKPSNARVKATQELTKNSDAKIAVAVSTYEKTKNSNARILKVKSLPKTSGASVFKTQTTQKTSVARVKKTKYLRYRGRMRRG